MALKLTKPKLSTPNFPYRKLRKVRLEESISAFVLGHWYACDITTYRRESWSFFWACKVKEPEFSTWHGHQYRHCGYLRTASELAVLHFLSVLPKAAQSTCRKHFKKTARKLGLPYETPAFAYKRLRVP